MRNMMTGFAGLVGILIVLAVAFAVFVRVAPSDPVRWHVDPVTVEPPGFPGAVLMRPGGDGMDSPRFDMSPDALMAAFDRVARASPRVTVLAGSVDDRHVTYIARSALFGFPDYITVRALPDGDGARLAVVSRLRFGYDDMGVNRARLEGWLARIDDAVPMPGA
ncbi:DUF1499 domain-containing protein [Meridianimarinicoccus sp. RP-17]|uniref:DUF1499 domain-containing protein n=1 Tax=Meridianimarinicoccus zhengii TaxID=2056810 RepID=UPI001F22ADEA|nr:DUF1499 domain-containing protein [Phycocomes zhengii]